MVLLVLSKQVVMVQYQLLLLSLLLVEVVAGADADGRAVLGVMHSHTHTEAYPSPTDVADASRFDPFGAWIFVIVSLKHPDPVLRAYRILDGEITEVPVEVERG